MGKHSKTKTSPQKSQPVSLWRYEILDNKRDQEKPKLRGLQPTENLQDYY